MQVTGFRGYKCGVWAPGFEQFEDAQLPMLVRNLCFILLRPAANTQH